jgi:hypothetical protein
VSGRALIVVALAVSVALVAAYLAAGGGDYRPTEVSDPCQPRDWGSPEGIDEAAEQFTLSALDGAACELQVSRETLAVALATPESREQFAAEYGIEDAELEAAVRAGVVRAIDDAERADALNPLVAEGLRAVAARLPVDEGIALIEDASELFDGTGGVLDELGGALDRAGGLLP